MILELLPFEGFFFANFDLAGLNLRPKDSPGEKSADFVLPRCGLCQNIVLSGRRIGESGVPT
jgi:hypothetical protein